MPTVLLAFDDNPFTPGQMAQLEALLPPDYEIVCGRAPETLAAVKENTEIVAGWADRDWLLAAPKLRWFQQWGAGADWLLNYPAAVTADFLLTNVSGIHAVPISEHIFAMILALGRHIPGSVRAAEAHRWGRLKQRGEPLAGPFDFPVTSMFELADKTMLIVGVGAIGARTAQVAEAFGMKVIGVRRHPDQSVPHVAEMIGPEQLLNRLPAADFVVLTVPFTRRTENMIGAAELAAMKEDCVLVNIGRGGTIDEEALLTALRSGQIRAAALDVFAEEPLPMRSPLWEQENLLITAHYAGGTPRYTERAFAIFRDNLGRYMRGEPLFNVVDKVEGY